MRLFDAATGALTQLLDPGGGRPTMRLAFSQDGSMLATQSPGLVRVWVLDAEDLLALARSKLTRGLTEDECRRALHLAACPASLDGQAVRRP